MMGLGSLLHFLNQIGTSYPNVSFFLTLVCFAWLGNAIMTQYLMQKQIRHTPSRVVFLITFSCSLSLLSMYLFQIMRFPISQYYWYIVLVILVLMCQLIIPLCLIFKLPFASYTFRICSFNIPFFGLLGCSLYICLLVKLLNDMWIQKGLVQFEFKLLIDMVVYYGVYLMALMSAYGAIWCPYVYYNLINQKQRSKIVHAKQKTKQQIHFIIEQTKTHKYELIKLKQAIDKLKKELSSQKKTEQSTVMWLFKGLTMGNRKSKQEELKKLQQKQQEHLKQLQTLKKVHQDSFLHYRDILEEQRRHMVSETLLGKLFRKFSFLLAFYSVTRIILTIINTIRGRKMSTDPITRLLNLLEWLSDKQFGQSMKQVSQYVSFIFMGYLMITSVRSFSMNFKAFLDYILRRKRLNILDSATQIYFFSLVYGVYFLAAVILQQSGLPRTYVSTFEMITGKINLLQHFVLFDWLFMGMCFFSICLMLFTEFQRRGKLDVIIRERNLIDAQ